MSEALVTVLENGTPAGRAAVRWAAVEATRRRAALRILGTGDDLALARAAHLARGVGAGPLLPERSTGSVGAALRGLAAGSGLLVLPAPVDDRIVERATCDVAVIPERVPTSGRVYVGVPPWAAPAVLTTAVEEAGRRGAELVAVRAWSDRRVDLGVVLPLMLRRWDSAAARATVDLDQALSPYRVAYPDLVIRAMVVRDDAAALLTLLSDEAEVMVLGHSGRGALAEALLGSPLGAVLHAGRCPVLVVPEDGPPRRRVLPRPSTRLARLRT